MLNPNTVVHPQADHVLANEDGCLSYQLSVSDTDPDALCIYERYVSKEYLETVHWQSQPFKAFGAGVRVMSSNRSSVLACFNLK